MNQLFQISHFYRSSKWIVVYIRGQQASYNVNREDFEQWLERTDRLEWINVTPDYSGEPVEETGTYTMKEYWALPSWQIERHLYEHIIYSQSDGYFDLKKSIDKVTRNSNVNPVFQSLINGI